MSKHCIFLYLEHKHRGYCTSRMDVRPTPNVLSFDFSRKNAQKAQKGIRIRSVRLPTAARRPTLNKKVA